MAYAKYALTAVGVLGLLGAATAARATTLADLISSGTPVTSGGVVCSNFSETGKLAASSIVVNFTSNGVQFTGNWNTLMPGNNNAVIGYNVAVNPAVGGTLTSSGLFFAGQVIVHNASATVAESLTDTKTGKPYNMNVYYDGPGGLTDNLSANVNFNPAVTSLNIIKTIDVAASFGAFASLNFVENNFTGGGTGAPPPPVIPEPMGLALLPLALAALGLRKKLGS